MTSTVRLLQLDSHVIAKIGERLVSPFACIILHPSATNGASAKLDDVTRILSELKADLDAKKLSTERMSSSTICQFHALIT